MERWPETIIATHSGLRGRPGVDLTDEVVALAVRRLACLLERTGLPRSLGLARDGRDGGDALAAAATEAARGCGLDVVDFGRVATPAAKLAARRRGLGGAVIVTGSHLEPDWNGLKLVAGPSYAPVDLRALPPPSGGGAPRGGLRRDHGAAGEHVDAICASVDMDAIRGARLAVSWDGSVGEEPALLLDRLGCTPGARSPDIVLLLDPDGDRLLLVDETGAELDPEAVLPLVALARGARTVVKGADTSRIVDAVVAAAGGTVHVVSPGELHLVEGLHEANGDLAGEGNGGVIVPAVGLARDGLAAGAAVLELVARAGRPLSALAAGLPRTVIRRSTVACSTAAEACSALAALAAHLGVEPPDDPEAGIRVERAGACGLVRRSATEPLLRVMAEAPAAEDAEELHGDLRAHLAAGAPA